MPESNLRDDFHQANAAARQVVLAKRGQEFTRGHRRVFELRPLLAQCHKHRFGFGIDYLEQKIVRVNRFNLEGLQLFGLAARNGSSRRCASIRREPSPSRGHQSSARKSHSVCPASLHPALPLRPDSWFVLPIIHRIAKTVRSWQHSQIMATPLKHGKIGLR